MPDTVTDHVRFPGGGGEQETWISRPSGSGRYPAIIMLHGRNGPNDAYRDVGVRYAEEGIVGVAVNYMTVEEDPSDPDEIETIRSALQLVQGLDYVRTDQIVLSGYCRGGGMTYLGLANVRGFAAGVVFHGGLGGGEINARHPEQQFDAAQRVDVPIIILHGMSDPGVPIQRVFDLAQRLNELGKHFELKAYWGTRHAFTLPGGGDYVPEHADDAFREAVLFIRRTFGLPVGTVGPLTRQPVGV